MHEQRQLDGRAMILLVVLCASWGLQQVAVKVAMDVVPPVTQAALRSLIAVVLIWVWMAVRRTPLWERDGTLGAGLIAGLMFAAEFLLIYWGLAYTTASRAVIFLYLSPFVVALGAQLFLPGEKLNRAQIFGLVLAFSGIVAAFGDAALDGRAETLIGDAMLVGAAILWGATTVFIKASRLATASAGKTLFYQLAVSAATLPLGAAALGENWSGALTPLAAGVIAFQGVWVAFVTYLTWFWLVRHYPAAKLASFTFLAPLFGVLAGVVLLGEPATPVLIAALALVGAGIYLVNRRGGP